MKPQVFLFSLLSAALVTAADYVLPVSDKWKSYDIVQESTPDAVRLRVKTNKNKFWGHIAHSFPKVTADQYLQVVVGEMESATANPQCGNASRNGGAFGRLYTGYNTFKMPNHALNRNGFVLTLALNGIRNADVGPWCDFKEVRATKNPLNAPVVTLLEGDTVKIGSKLKIQLRLAKDLAITPEVRFSLNPKFLPYQFNKDKSIKLQRVAPATYEATFTVDKNAISFSSSKTKKYEIYASVKINLTNCYYKLPYPVEISTGNLLDESVLDAANNQVRDDRKLWLERSRGINLIRNRRLLYAPKPEYVHTRKGDTDPLDLTNGRLSPRTDDRVWFEKSSVGWYNTGNDIYIRMDLGKVQPVDKLVIRLLGGTNGNFKFPKQFQAFVSKDGKIYHQAFSMEKLAPNEQDQCDWKNYYYLPEDAEHPNTRCYPFEIGVNADARFVIFNIKGTTGAVFSDEMVCLKAVKKSAGFNNAYQNPGIEIPMSGLIIRPRLQEVVLLNGIAAAQWLRVVDMRTAEDFHKDIDYVLEVPQGVTVYNTKGQPYPASTKYVLPLNRISKPGQRIHHPFFFIKANGNVNGKITIYARSGGVEQFKTTLPLRTVTVPEVKPFKRLQLSLAWLSDAVIPMWPDYFNVWRKLGFNTVTMFPRNWSNKGMIAHRIKLMDQTRAAGYPIIMNDSPYHEMHRHVKKHPEINCTIPGQKTLTLCPSYRGPLFQQEMDRIKRNVILTKPDYVYWDIETWTSAHSTAPHCTRCQAGMKRTGLSVNEYLLLMGDETNAALKKAVVDGAKEAGIPVPKIGSYAREAFKQFYYIEDWKRSYPAYFDMAQPSLYVVGRAVDVHHRILANYKLMKNKNIMPYLTAGTYGEFEPHKVEQMVLEALVNGAGGITYFDFNSFDTPLDFYYHAKAMAAIQDHEDLILDGIPQDITGSNKKMVYSITVKGNEAILLVGNYDRATPETSIKLPFAPSVMKDLREKKDLKPQGQNLKLNVPRGDI
ncbi:MAG: hypothetical protein IJW23_06000, partial [Lentisphaeria bacterium]|nr:hypothetical protein [Lentisphaeria bacterium]